MKSFFSYFFFLFAKLISLNVLVIVCTPFVLTIVAVSHSFFASVWTIVAWFLLVLGWRSQFLNVRPSIAVLAGDTLQVCRDFDASFFYCANFFLSFYDSAMICFYSFFISRESVASNNVVCEQRRIAICEIAIQCRRLDMIMLRIVCALVCVLAVDMLCSCSRCRRWLRLDALNICNDIFFLLDLNISLLHYLRTAIAIFKSAGRSQMQCASEASIFMSPRRNRVEDSSSFQQETSLAASQIAMFDLGILRYIFRLGCDDCQQKISVRWNEEGSVKLAVVIKNQL